MTAEYVAAALLNILAHKQALAFLCSGPRPRQHTADALGQGHDSTVSSALIGRHKGICTLLEQGSNLFVLRTGRHHTVRSSGDETSAHLHHAAQGQDSLVLTLSFRLSMRTLALLAG